MAVRQVLVDDLDGTTDDVHTVTFALDSATYTIDLSTTNHDQLAAALAPYINAGRRLKANPSPQPRVDAHRVRAWWRDNADRLGLPGAKANGVIPARVLDAYRNRSITPDPDTTPSR